MATTDQVKTAIAALSAGQDVTQANSWLIEFEKSVDAWHVAELLLQEPRQTPYRFFGAKFLYSKLSLHYFQLASSESPDHVLQVLIQGILKLSTEAPVEYTVCRYLCLGLAAFAVQRNQPKLISFILQSLNNIAQSCPGILLMFLQVLPEEAGNKRILISSAQRQQFIQELREYCDQVIRYIATYRQVVTGKDRCHIFKCAENWLDIVNVPLEILHQQEMIYYSLQSLAQEHGEVFDYAVDFCIAVLRKSSQDYRIMEQILPVIIGLQSRWEALMKNIQQQGNELDETDREEAFSLCRLFTETAESCFPIFTNISQNYGQDSLMLQLLQCTQFYVDPNVARIPLKFFYDLSLQIILPGNRQSQHSPSANYADDGSNNSPTSQQALHGQDQKLVEMLNQKYGPIYNQLLFHGIQHMLLTPTVLQSDATLPDERSSIRSEWADTMQDCCYVLSMESTMRLLCDLLQQEMLQYQQQASAQPQNVQLQCWCRVESILFAISTIMPCFQPNRHTSVLSQLPVLFDFLCNRMPTVEFPQLQITALYLLGRLSLQISSYPQYLQHIYQRLKVGLQHPKTCIVASRAVISILKVQLTGENGASNGLDSAYAQQQAIAGELIPLVQELRNIASFPLEAELNLLEGLATYISDLQPIEVSATTWKSLVYPICTGLEQTIDSQKKASATTASSSSSAQYQMGLLAISSYLDRLGVCLKHYHRPSLLFTDIFVQTLSPCKVLVQELDIHERICEKLCKIYRLGLQNSGLLFVNYLSNFCEFLVQQFHRYPVAAFLYAASACFSNYALAEQGQYVPMLYDMLWKLSQQFFQYYPNYDRFVEKPDIVEEYFFLLAKALQYCPGPFVQAEGESTAILEAAMIGLKLEHREAQKGIFLFFDRLVQTTSHWSADHGAMTLLAMTRVRSVGGRLVLALMQLLASEVPLYALDESNGCITDVLWGLRKKFPEEFQTWVQDALRTLSPAAQSIASSQGVLPALQRVQHIKEFTQILDHFEAGCRRAL